MTQPYVGTTSLEALLSLVASGGLRFDNRPAFQLIIPSNAGPNDPRIEIGGTLPPDLVAYYAANSYTAISGIVFYDPPDEYEYMILALNAAGAGTLCFGSRNSAGVADTFQLRSSTGVAVPTVTFGQFLDNLGQVILASTFTLDMFGDILIESGSILGVLSGGTILVQSGAALQADGGSAAIFNGSISAAQLQHLDDVQVTPSTSASTTYANLTNICGVAFIAPLSGIVTIHWACQQSNNAATGGSALAPWIGTGSTVGAGTEVIASSDVNALAWTQHATVSEGYRAGRHYTATGLTPGDQYNVSIRMRSVTAGTALFDDIHCTVVPSP